MRNQEPEFISKGFKALSSSLKKYIEKRLELSAIESGEHLSVFLANLAHQLSGLVIFSCGLLFVLLALGIYLGGILNSISLGLVLVSLPLFLLGALFVNMKPRSLTNSLKRIFCDEIFRTMREVKKMRENSQESSPEDK